jgi:hypothetical protein
LPGERLTIDVTVVRDYQEPTSERHPHAVALFDLARRGEVELLTAPQGYRLDVQGDLAEQLRETFAGEGVGEAPQLAYVSEVTYPAMISSPATSSRDSPKPGTRSRRRGGRMNGSHRHLPTGFTSRRT